MGYGKGYILPNKHEMTLQEEMRELLLILCLQSLSALPLRRLIGNIKSKLGFLGDSNIVTHYCSQTVGASGK